MKSMARRGWPYVVVALVAASSWLVGLGFIAAGLALDNPPWLRDGAVGGTSTGPEWTLLPPGQRYVWTAVDGSRRTAIDPWAGQSAAAWAWTLLVIGIGVVGCSAVRRHRTRRTRSLKVGVVAHT